MTRWTKRERPQIDKARREEWLRNTRLLLNTELCKKRKDGNIQWLIEQLESDEPLCRFIRDCIADQLRESLSDSPEQNRKPREELRSRQNRAAHMLKKSLRRDCGMTADEANEEVAKFFGISVSALKQRLKRDPDVLVELGVPPPPGETASEA